MSDSPPAAPAACIACGAAPRAGLTLPNGRPLLRCPGCKLGWWDWSGLDAAALYSADYFQSAQSPHGYDDYAALEPGIHRTARTRLTRLKRLLAPGLEHPAVLDVGCGTGCFLLEAAAKGWSCRGVEVSAYAADLAQQRGLDVLCGELADVDAPPASFDVVTFWDVIEHLPRPDVALQRAATLLKPGGVLALSTGDLSSWCARLSGRRWHLFNLPEHLFFFTPASLKRLTAQRGLRTVRIAHEINWVSLSYLAERLGKTLLRRSVRIPAAGMFVPATLWDVVGLYAVRCAA